MKKIIIFISLMFGFLNAVQVSDIASFSNTRSNFLYGKGLVIGLKGTGDRTKFTNVILNNILNKENIKVDEKKIRSKNIASVIITAKLSPFLKKGDMFNVDVSSIGDSKSIKGGRLILTFLKGANGEIYATCQGKIVVDKEKNNGIIKEGCILEREVPNKLINKVTYNLSLNYPNLEYIYKIKKAINEKYGYNTAVSVDMKNIKITKPETYDSLDFMYEISKLDIDAVKSEVVVIDMTSKMVISGNNIHLKDTVAIAKDFNIRIKNGINVYKNTKNKVEVINNNLNRVPTVGNLVYSLKELNVPFEEIKNVLYNLKKEKAFSNQIIVR